MRITDALDNADAKATAINECLLQSPILANLNGDVTRSIFEEWLGPIQRDDFPNDITRITPKLTRKGRDVWNAFFSPRLTFFDGIQLQRPPHCQDVRCKDKQRSMCRHMFTGYPPVGVLEFYENL